MYILNTTTSSTDTSLHTPKNCSQAQKIHIFLLFSSHSGSIYFSSTNNSESYFPEEINPPSVVSLNYPNSAGKTVLPQSSPPLAEKGRGERCISQFPITLG